MALRVDARPDRRIEVAAHRVGVEPELGLRQHVVAHQGKDQGYQNRNRYHAENAPVTELGDHRVTHRDRAATGDQKGHPPRDAVHTQRADKRRDVQPRDHQTVDQTGQRSDRERGSEPGEKAQQRRLLGERAHGNCHRHRRQPGRKGNRQVDTRRDDDERQPERDQQNLGGGEQNTLYAVDAA